MRHLASGLILLLIVGTLGFTVIEGWPLGDSLYMTVITLTTVGFGETHPLSEAGRWFTVALILIGVGAMAFVISRTHELLLSDEARRRWQRRRRQGMIDRLENHVIICGFGQMGHHVAQSLTGEKASHVVIERNPEIVQRAEADGHVVLEGDASDEATLRRAGIDKARALITAVDSDAQSVFIVLTARALRPGLRIIARANLEDSEPKLLRAGADRVILPYLLSGQRMVSLVTRPAVADFLDVVMHSGDLELRLEQVEVAEGAPIVGQTLAEARPREAFGVSVLAIERPGRPALTAPQAEDRFEAGCRVVAMGTAEGLSSFSRSVGTRAQAR